MRLIGIKLGPCDHFVSRNLQINSWYPFGNYQEPTAKNGWKWRTANQIKDEIPCRNIYKSMAAEDTENSLDVTVNCIVGKNGSGKSTLLDILYRLLNNFSYQLLDKMWIDNSPENNPQSGHNLSEACQFDATLFFETDGTVGSIRYAYGDYEYNYYSDVEDSKFESYPMKKNISKSKLEQITRHLFYTICTNYSIYSLNEKDYKPNRLWIFEDKKLNGEWVKGLFNKNDGYVAPIVMVPFRYDGGNIDVNTEKELAKQRLSTLAILFASQGHKFLEDYSPKHIVYRFRHDAKIYYNLRFNNLYREKLPLDNGITILKREIQNVWKSNLIGHHKNGYKSLPKTVREAVISYLTYKTLKICLLYRKYGEKLGIRSFTEDEEFKVKAKKKSGYRLEFREGAVVEIVNDILFVDTQVHTNQKIYQLLHFVDIHLYNVENLELPKNFPDGKYMDGYGWSQMDVSGLYMQKINGTYKRVPFKTYDDAYRSMPPAIFEWDISLTKKGEDVEYLSQMSSGEKQMMQSMSYIIYHLKNLQSITEGSYRVRYHNVCLVFDEAELYYHPDYQRKFISNLIRWLSWSNINHNIIRGINIVIVTHSPFVLSDVPLEHTLYLKEGKLVNKTKQTFGSNVHEMLGSSFFMDYSIGDVARKNIEEIIKLYNRRTDINHYQDNKSIFEKHCERYRYVASLIADEYLKSVVDKMMKELMVQFVDDKQNDTIEAEIEKAKKHLALLEKRKLMMYKEEIQ